MLSIKQIQAAQIYGNAYHDAPLSQQLHNILMNRNNTTDLRHAAYIKLGEIVGKDTNLETIDNDIEAYVVDCS